MYFLLRYLESLLIFYLVEVIVGDYESFLIKLEEDWMIMVFFRVVLICQCC